MRIMRTLRRQIQPQQQQGHARSGVNLPSGAASCSRSAVLRQYGLIGWASWHICLKSVCRVGINTTDKGGHTDVHIERHRTSAHMPQQQRRDSISAVVKSCGYDGGP